jgi:phosphatidylglycerophosphate synthase
MFYNIQFSFWYLFYGSILTYLVWGFIVAFEVNLAMSGSKMALEWIGKHHSYRQLYGEVKVFYPMILLGYFFLEVLPHRLWHAPQARFDLDGLFKALYDPKEKGQKD